jgi:hypothetical protein
MIYGKFGKMLDIQYHWNFPMIILGVMEEEDII